MPPWSALNLHGVPDYFFDFEWSPDLHIRADLEGAGLPGIHTIDHDIRYDGAFFGCDEGRDEHIAGAISV